MKVIHTRQKSGMKQNSADLYIKVLMYHGIVDSDNPSAYDVSLYNFKQHIKLLEYLNYTAITFEDYRLYQEGLLTLPRKPIILTFDDGHSNMVETALPVLREHNMKAVVFVLGNRSLKYANWDNGTAPVKDRLMSNSQILQLRAEGFEIGAHSMTHPRLPQLSLARMRSEITDSKKAIEDLLSEEVCSFAYPYGELNNHAQRFVKEAGFKYGCGVFTGPPRFGANPFDIRRLAIYNHTNSVKYLLRLLAPYEYVEWLYGKMKSGKVNLNEKPPTAHKQEYDITANHNS